MGKLPLYSPLVDEPAPCPRQGHAGLYWDKFFAYSGEFCTEKSIQLKDKAQWLKYFDGKSVGHRQACEQACLRLRRLTVARGGISQVFKASWRLVVGMGLPHPMDNGLLWHPVLGTPYLPGSAVKGLVRSWVEAWDDDDGLTDKKVRRARLRSWFGSEGKDPATQPDLPPGEVTADHKAGQFIFFDALPTGSVKLKADVMTPHLGQWYEQGAINPGKPDTVPADWHSPVPIGFLTADQISLQFCIAPRHNADCKALPLVFDALKNALEWLGAGAKTAVGYGQMELDEKKTAEFQKILQEQAAAAHQAAQKHQRIGALDSCGRAIYTVIGDAAIGNDLGPL